MHEMVNKSFVFTFVVLLDPHADQLVHWKIDWSSTFSSCKTNQFISRLMPPLYKKPIGANAGFQLQLSELTYTCLKPHYTSTRQFVCNCKHWPKFRQSMTQFVFHQALKETGLFKREDAQTLLQIACVYDPLISSNHTQRTGFEELRNSGFW